MASNNKSASVPLSGVRVVNIGSSWAGRVAAMLLADQGADVVEFVRPGRAVHPCDPLLDRGKRLLEIDLNDSAASKMAHELVAGSDVVFENMRAGTAARLQLDYASLDNRERIVYVSLPGFAEGDDNHTMPAWEGVVDAAVGIYTDISPLGPLIGGDPVYTAIPMASAYGGVLGAVTASMGLYHRERSGQGQRAVVPLADAVLSAMALLIAKIDGQPQRYNFPSVDHTMMHTVFPILRELREHLTDEHVARIVDFLKSRAMPGLNFYECADGRILFVCAMDHVYQTRAFLQTVGVYDRAIAEGMVADNPYSENRDGNNLNNAGDLTQHNRQRLLTMISDSIKTRPGKEWEQILRDANVPVTVVQTDSEWLADAKLLEAGVVADIEDPKLGTVRMPGRFVSIAGAAVRSPQLRPRQKVTGADWQQSPLAPASAGDSASGGLLAGVRVLDLSNIIAGPAAGRTLAEHGADVVRIDSPAPQAGPRITMWFGVDVNQGKRAVVLDLKTEAGREVMARLVKDSDVVLHNFLDHSARSLGIAHDQLAAINPDIISCQISAWGGSEGGPFKDDPAFDPVLQAATGIMTRYGRPDKPILHAIASCVDYITGYSAALGIAQALFAREQGHGGSYVRTSLAMGAQLVQFPFMTRHAESEQIIPSGQAARGDGCEQHLYQLADGWAFVGCRAGDGAKLASAVGAETVSTGSVSPAAIADKLRDLPLASLREKLAALPGAAAIAVQTLAQLRDRYTIECAAKGSDSVPANSFRLRLGPHPSGYPTTIPLATWIRPELSALTPLHPAPSPGEHSVSVLRDAGYTEEEVATLVDNGVVHTRWKLLRHYLPH
ncbi:MAG: CoA transferase [Betaproteobacteria bacterium]|nr:MAG: CoA transferase [Betaproteobacteria bacterium]